MSYYTYILYSNKLDKYYYGQTNNLLRRIEEHNSGVTKSTKAGIPWEIVFSKSFKSRTEAVQLEQRLKKAKNKKYIKWFIENSDFKEVGGSSRFDWDTHPDKKNRISTDIYAGVIISLIQNLIPVQIILY